jgi:hypothetical protein
VNCSTGWPFHCAPFRRLKSSETGFPRVLRATAFAPTPRPASLPLRSAKPPHSCRPGFELVPQPGKPLRSAYSPICSGYDARSRSARTARLGLRKWATAPLRAFQAGRQDIAAPRLPLYAPLPRPVAKTCRLWLPLERLRRQTRQDLAPPLKLP